MSSYLVQCAFADRLYPHSDVASRANFILLADDAEAALSKAAKLPLFRRLRMEPVHVLKLDDQRLVSYLKR